MASSSKTQKHVPRRPNAANPPTTQPQFDDEHISASGTLIHWVARHSERLPYIMRTSERNQIFSCSKYSHVKDPKENKSVHKNNLCRSNRHYRKKKMGKSISMDEKLIDCLPKIFNRSSMRSRSSLKLPGKKTLPLIQRRNWKKDSGHGVVHRRERRKRRKRKKKSIVQDEVSCLQGRARYLLIKMKLELNLIDAYSGEGWKGQSKEKIKPETELQRAGKQILKCKLGIRDIIRQMDLFSSEGRIADSVMCPDGSVSHEHIFCAKCKAREAFPDNDIILCDGTCNCGFHQKCLEPPLENNQGWLCKICECRVGILEAINAHIGTNFTINSSWEDVFKEATASLDTENASLNLEEWPSDDSSDEDYHPEHMENSNCSIGTGGNMSDEDSSSSSFSCSSYEVSASPDLTHCHCRNLKERSKEDFEPVDSLININYSEASDREITSYRRQRRDVDYKKLHEEMFGKELNDMEEQSEDEDWGPQSRKRRRELNAGTVFDHCGDDGFTNLVLQENILCVRKKLYRIPQEAVEKLRQVFSENELPSRQFREKLSQELGISAEKIGKWFKNARYAALKLRKTTLLHQFISRQGQVTKCLKKSEMTNQSQFIGNAMESRRGKHSFDAVESMDSSYLLPLSSIIRLPRNLRKKTHQRKSSSSTAAPPKEQHKEAASEVNASEANSASKELLSIKGITDPQADGTIEKEQLFAVKLEKLFYLEDRLQKLKNTLSTCTDESQVPNKTHPRPEKVMYIPVAEVKEKARSTIIAQQM